MHERKALMAELSDGFVALPGGAGTLEELFEVWTWAPLGYHAKPCDLLDVAGFYSQLVAFLDGMTAQGFSAAPVLLLPWNAQGPALVLRGAASVGFVCVVVAGAGFEPAAFRL